MNTINWSLGISHTTKWWLENNARLQRNQIDSYLIWIHLPSYVPRSHHQSNRTLGPARSQCDRSEQELGTGACRSIAIGRCSILRTPTKMKTPTPHCIFIIYPYKFITCSHTFITCSNVLINCSQVHCNTVFIIYSHMFIIKSHIFITYIVFIICSLTRSFLNSLQTKQFHNNYRPTTIKRYK